MKRLLLKDTGFNWYFIKTSCLILVKRLLIQEINTEDSGLSLVACGRKPTFAAQNYSPTLMDVFGEALRDFYTDKFTQKLILHTSYGEPEDMPLDIFFRDEEEMSETELEALSCCYGKVLDIGAGVGSHALALQALELNVTALEISPLATEIMRERGVKEVINQDIFSYSGSQYDTLLLLMNGIGLVGDITGLRQFLQHARKLLNPNGQLMFDSSDVAYLYEGNLPEQEPYYGEIAYQYEYKGVKGPWFKWLYIDQDTLAEIAGEEGWLTIIQYQDEQDQYLARLILA